MCWTEIAFQLLRLIIDAILVMIRGEQELYLKLFTYTIATRTKTDELKYVHIHIPHTYQFNF